MMTAGIEHVCIVSAVNNFLKTFRKSAEWYHFIFRRAFDKMEGLVDIEGLEECKDLEHGFEGIEENRRVDYDIVLPNLNDPKANDILYHLRPAPYGFFACIAVLLRDVFYFICFGSGYTKFSTNDDGDVEMLPSRLKTRLQREMTDTYESSYNAIHSRADQFWVKHEIEDYSRQGNISACQASRLQAPARMVFTNEKLIGPPPAQENDGIVYQRPGRQSISFHKPDGTPLSNSKTNVEEPPINDDGNVTKENAIKYEDVVKESRGKGLFGWRKPTNIPPACNVDVNMAIDEDGREQKDLPEEEYKMNKRERELWF